MEYPTLSAQETTEFLELALSEWEGLVDTPRTRTRTRFFTPTEREAARVIHRLTGGVVREIQRLMEQVQRVVRLNALKHMDPDVVLLASEGLFRSGRRKRTLTSSTSRLSRST